jgi:hypothetical protein
MFLGSAVEGGMESPVNLELSDSGTTVVSNCVKRSLKLVKWNRNTIVHLVVIALITISISNVKNIPWSVEGDC